MNRKITVERWGEMTYWFGLSVYPNFSIVLQKVYLFFLPNPNKTAALKSISLMVFFAKSRWFGSRVSSVSAQSLAIEQLLPPVLLEFGDEIAQALSNYSFCLVSVLFLTFFVTGSFIWYIEEIEVLVSSVSFGGFSRDSCWESSSSSFSAPRAWK